MTMSVVLQLVDEMSDQVNTAVRKSRGALEGFADDAKRLSTELREFGQVAVAAGAVVTGALGITVKKFADLESGLAGLKATMTGKGGLSENFQAVSDLAISLGNQLPGNTQDFANMINKLLQLGVAEQDVLGGVGEAAAKLAAVMKLPYEEAATVAAKLKEATGTANTDMLQFMDTLQRVGHQGVAASEMMYAFARSSGGLKQFAIQGLEASKSMSALFALLLKGGMSGETAGTNLVSMLNTLAKWDFNLYSDKKQAEVQALQADLRKLGIELDFFDNQTKEFKGVENMVAQLGQLQALDQERMTQVLQTMFGGGQDQQIAALLAQGGTQKFAAMQQSMADQADLATRSAVQLQTLSARWEAAFGTFENLLAKIGELLAPKLGEFVDWFGATSERVQSWIENNRGLAEAIATIAGGIGAALVAIGGVGLTAAGIAATFGAVATGLGAIATAATAAAPVLAALAANPVALAILGVGAAAVVGWKFGGWIAEQINVAVEAIAGPGATLGTALFQLVEGFKAKLQAIPTWISEKLASMRKAFSDLGIQMRSFGILIVQGLIDGIKERALAMIASAKQLAADIVGAVKSALSIRSPSQVMFDLGQQTAQGFALGLQAGTVGVAEAAGQMAGVVGGMGPGGAVVDDPAARQAYQAQIEADEQSHQSRLLGIRNFFESQSLAGATRYRKMNVDSMGFFFSQIGALMQTKSRSLFEIGKAGAIGETIVNTYRAAQGAYAALAGIPVVGPALGVAAAASAVLVGMARVAAIRSTSFGSTSASPMLSGGGMSGPVVAGDAAVVPITAPQRLPTPERTINLILSGEGSPTQSYIRDVLIPGLNEALGDGVTLNVRPA
jgi:TP901 family phage tail tape measure protein